MTRAERYPAEELGEDEDNGTMPSNVAELADAVRRRLLRARRQL